MIKNKENLFDSSLKAGLYLINCKPKQKYYIGQSGNVIPRLNAHKSKLRRNCHENREMQKDFNLLGLNCFTFQKLNFGIGCDKKEREKFETLILLTLPKENRYNAYSNWRSGEGNPFYGKKHTSLAREAIANAKKGLKSPFADHHQTNKVKQLLSQQNSGVKDRRKPLYIDSVYYQSVSEASLITGLSRRLIRERCHSSHERFKNYQWAQSF